MASSEKVMKRTSAPETVRCDQGTAKWHQLRCGVVTASNFNRVLAKGRGIARRTYMQSLLGEYQGEGYQSDAMLRGLELEPEARRAYCAATGHTVEEVGFVFFDKERRVGASPDGLIGDDGGLEIKCPSEDTHLDYLTDETLPSKYLPQVQGALWVTGRAWWDFVSYSPEFHNGSRMFIHRVYRDETYIKRLATEVGRFVKELSGKLGR